MPKKGRVSFISPVQFNSALEPICVIFELSVNSSSERQSLNERFPIEVTVSGITTDLREVQLVKRLSLIAVIPSGITMLSKELQFVKAFTPMFVTVA